MNFNKKEEMKLNQIILSIFSIFIINNGMVIGNEINDKTCPSQNSIQLQYWNGRGLMEIARMILAIAGKFPQVRV